jgi:SAM-dependent methyltransferase
VAAWDADGSSCMPAVSGSRPTPTSSRPVRTRPRCPRDRRHASCGTAVPGARADECRAAVRRFHRLTRLGGPVIAWPRSSPVVQQPQSGSRPSSQRGAVGGGARSVVLWETLCDRLGPAPATSPGVTPRRVVDLGGGTGGLAVRVAELGHHVTVVDPSPDALASFHRRAAESGVEGRVVGSRATRPTCSTMSTGSADLVLCHGVLEWSTTQGRHSTRCGAIAPQGRPPVRSWSRVGSRRPVLGRALAVPGAARSMVGAVQCRLGPAC